MLHKPSSVPSLFCGHTRNPAPLPVPLGPSGQMSLPLRPPDVAGGLPEPHTGEEPDCDKVIRHDLTTRAAPKRSTRFALLRCENTDGSYIVQLQRPNCLITLSQVTK